MVPYTYIVEIQRITQVNTQISYLVCQNVLGKMWSHVYLIQKLLLGTLKRNKFYLSKFLQLGKERYYITLEIKNYSKPRRWCNGMQTYSYAICLSVRIKFSPDCNLFFLQTNHKLLAPWTFKSLVSEQKVVFVISVSVQ